LTAEGWSKVVRVVWKRSSKGGGSGWGREAGARGRRAGGRGLGIAEPEMADVRTWDSGICVGSVNDWDKTGPHKFPPRMTVRRGGASGEGGMKGATGVNE